MAVSSIFSINQRLLFVNICIYLSSLFLLSFTFYLQSESSDENLSKRIIHVLTFLLYHSLTKASTLFIIGLLLVIVTLLIIFITLMIDTKATKKTQIGKPDLQTELVAKWKGQSRQRKKLSEGETTVINLLMKYFFGKLVFEKQEKLFQGIIDHVNKTLELPTFIGNLEIRELKLGDEIIHLDYASVREYDVEIDYVEYLKELVNQGVEEKNQTLKSKEGCGKGLEIDLDLSYFDPEIIFRIFTRIWVDIPIPQLLSIPIEASIEKIGFDVKLRIRIDDLWNRMWISFREKPLYHFVLGNAVGEKPLKNLPILSQIINKQLDSLLSLFVFPKEVEIPLPSTFTKIQRESIVSLLLEETTQDTFDQSLHEEDKNDLLELKLRKSSKNEIISPKVKFISANSEGNSKILASDFDQKKNQ